MFPLVPQNEIYNAAKTCQGVCEGKPIVFLRECLQVLMNELKYEIQYPRKI